MTSVVWRFLGAYDTGLANNHRVLIFADGVHWVMDNQEVFAAAVAVTGLVVLPGTHACCPLHL